MKVNISSHPLVQVKVGQLRKQDIQRREFRRIVKEVGAMLSYEVLKDLPLSSQTIETWIGALDVPTLDQENINLIPILRAGLGMMEGALTVVPDASISVVGVYRDEQTLKPISYFEKLVPELGRKVNVIVDPMLATGGSMLATIELLKKRGAKNIKAMVLVAAPEGVKAVNQAYPDVELFTAVLDEKLNEKGYILPGLGDAGDKIFGTIV